MKFSVAILAVAAAFGLASGSPVLEARQEAVRFGVVNTHPTSVKLGEEFTVTYNSTLARWQPKFLDVYISGVYPSGFVTPSYQLLRVDYPPTSHSLTFQTTLPILDNSDVNKGYLVNGSYAIWAYITFPTDSGALAVGGTSTGIGIDGLS
ncbi:hypothetical protein BDW22DRAFT_1482602 [Trametopsis cervina]|nr:hypothetical protein BDW22DRAFT_1482602 [Trametopsis cervina]